MAAVILEAIRPPVVTEAQVVSDFVRCGLGNVGLIVGQIVDIDPRGPVIGIRARAENIDVGDAARRGIRVRIAIGIGVARDQGVGGPRGKGSRAFRGHINVERRVILGHPLPDALDGQLLRVTEGRVIRIRAEGHGGDGTTPDFGQPLTGGNGFAGKIDEQNIRRAGPAVKHQARWKWTDGNGCRGDDGFISRWNRRGLQCENVGIEDSTIRVYLQ